MLMRKYELPYNFDKKLIDGYKILNLPFDMIDCIYVPPFLNDYESIIRNINPKDTFVNLTYDEYIEHIQYINSLFPGKLQLLLQRVDGTLMPSYMVKKYIGLGFKNFCVGTIEQAKIIKEINPELKVVGSIAMHISRNKIKHNYYDYKKYFDIFVLDFSFNKNFLEIKLLPKDFKYMLLVNSRCNIHCNGDHHWWNIREELKCPGIMPNISIHQSCIIKPTDLHLFDPYIEVYKIADRGWPTEMIMREVVLYTTEYYTYFGSTISDPSAYQTY